MRRHSGPLVLLALSLLASTASAATLDRGLARRLSGYAAGDSVPVILNLADQADLTAFQGVRAQGGAVVSRLRAVADESQAAVLAFLAARGLHAQSFWINNCVAVRVPAALIPEIEARRDLARIDYDEPVTLVDDDRDARGPRASNGGTVEWNLAMVHAPEVWKLGFDGTGIVVGSIDTGFDPTHPALQGKWRGGTNSWHDFVNGQPNPYDDHGHGTHTIGTMVGGDGPGSGPFPIDVGLAYHAKFISAKAIDSNNSFSSASSVIAAAQWMLDPDGNPATDDFPDVINNSWLFFDQGYQGFHSSVTAWRAAGIIPVFALGNNGPGGATGNPPGTYDNTIGVGATDSNDLIASFSSRGPSPSGPGFPADLRKPDVSAPGVSVYSSVPGGGYQYWFGTSMAAPHVAGTVALMLQAHPGPMSYDEVRSALIGTSVDRGAPGYDYDYGYGRLDALAAVTEALSPGIHLAAASSGHTIQLGWNASTLPGPVHYEIYRSPVFDDFAATLIATTNDTSFSDPHRIGRFYYRVRAVSPSGTSPFTNEAVAMACAPDPPTCYGVDALTTSPVAADFNADGNLDVVLANTLPTGAVRVALGNGSGQFPSIVSYPTGARPMGIAIGDFNGDGITDLATANNNTTGTVSILMGLGASGHGNGSFSAPVDYPTSSKPAGLVAADFDQDGILDLAAACNGLNNVSILRGNGSNGHGDGTFSAPVSYTVGTQPTSLVTGDFNDDGALDLAVSNASSGRVSVLIGHRTDGHADGTFAAAASYPCGSNPAGIATGDFDGDGILDLAVARNVNPGFVSILRGLGSAGVGDGTFAPLVGKPAGGLLQGLDAGDLNGDGITDLCAASGTSDGTVSVLLGTGAGGVGDGGFEAPVPLAGGNSVVDLALADFDHSGGPDLAIANLSGVQNLCVLETSCSPDVGTNLTVVSPNGGESWPISTAQTITWSKQPGVISVDIDLSRDHGATWQTIATHQTGTSFQWWVTNPQTLTPSARIRVSDSRVSRADASNADFTIAPDIRTGAPEPRAAEGLALAVRNPAVDRLSVRFRLAESSSATLEVLDLGGRRVARRSVGGLGAGDHTLELARGIGPGVYLVRLTQGAERITTKAAVLR